MQTQRFDIQGASCQSCVRKIREALSAIAGIDDVQVDLDAQQVTVTGTADSADVQAALAKAGYASKTRRLTLHQHRPPAPIRNSSLPLPVPPAPPAYAPSKTPCATPRGSTRHR